MSRKYDKKHLPEALQTEDYPRTRQKSSLGNFFIGLIMMIAGGYLFLDAIQVTHHFAWGSPMFHVGSMRMTPGLIMIPFLFGIGLIFYNPDNDIGWLLVIATLVMLAVGIISSIHFRLRPMSALELMMILGLAIGGLGLFLSSMRRL